MKTEPATAAVEDPNDEISKLVSRLIETEQRLLELTQGQVDAVLDPGGRSYLLRQAQERLFQSEAGQRHLAQVQMSILNALPANIALIDGDGVIVSVNQGWQRFAGANALQDSSSGLGQNYLKICEQAEGEHAEESHAVATGIRSVLAGKLKKFELEYPCHSPREQKWFRLLVTPLHEASRDGAVVMHLNVTERKQMEMALEQSELRHRSLFENMLEGYTYCQLLYDEQGRAQDYIYLHVNGAFEPQTGLKNVVGKKVSEVVPGMHEANPEQLEIYSRVAATGQPEQFDTYAKLLGIWFSVSVYSHEKGYFIAIFDNITERKRVEQTLRESEALQRIAGRIARLGGWSYELAGSKLVWSDEVCVIHGMPPGSKISVEEALNFYPPEWRQIVSPTFERCIREGVPFDLEVEIVVQGRRVRGRSAGEAVRNGQGVIIRVQGAFQDITERKQAEQSLIRMAAIVESSNDAIFSTDLDGNITHWNKGAEKIYGYQAGEIIGTSILRLIPVERHDEERHILERLKNKEEVQNFETWRLKKDGKPVNISVAASAIKDATGRIVGVSKVGRDITEHRKLEAQLRQSQKMEAIGQLAGGVAHDFNNILAVIQMQVGLLKMDGELSPAQLAYAEDIEKSSQRAADLTRQLLMFARRQMMQPRDLDLNVVVENMTKMLRRILGEDIRMQFKYAAEALPINADAGMMDQILLNLTVNSRDAMPKGGQLIIETSAVEFDRLAAAKLPNARAGSFVCLSVSDTGAGIPAEALPRIFEPFFTTKDVGKGTGLGLATVFGIVQQHQGWIHVYSEVGKGTVFKIYLPRLNKTLAPTAQPALPPLNGGNETILLVEDDPSLRAAVRTILSQLGYRIIEAQTGASALEAWKKNQSEIRMLLTDLVMPDGMNGKELAQQLLKENPELKVIYTSGYSADLAGKDFPLQEGVNFLTKPFETHKLAKMVRDCLNLKKH